MLEKVSTNGGLFAALGRLRQGTWNRVSVDMAALLTLMLQLPPLRITGPTVRVA